MSTHNKSIYMELPQDYAGQKIKAISAPMHLPTALGHWVHMAAVEIDNVPDPSNVAQMLNAVKEHSILIYNNGDLSGDLLKIPFTDLVKSNENEPIEIRIHSLCRFGDALHGQNCDCGPQLFSAMCTIMNRGSGIIFYLDQEGRNAGLTAKTAANRLEQTSDINTSQTFQSMGLNRNDFRQYGVVIDALNLLGITKVRLMSNNPTKIQALTEAGIEVVQHPIHVPATTHSAAYLQAKRDYMGHMRPDDVTAQNGSNHAQVIFELREMLPYLKPEHLRTLRDIIKAENNSPFITNETNIAEIVEQPNIEPGAHP